jgi:hypothetical protein
VNADALGTSLVDTCTVNLDQNFDRRRLRFEAKRFAIETFVKIHLEHAEGSRLLLVSHSRLMFTLSLGALAGTVTLFAAALRQSGPPSIALLGLAPIVLAALSLAFLVTAAILATRVLHSAASAATELLRQPFPNAERELEEAFDNEFSNEQTILDRVASTILLRLKKETAHQPRTIGITLFLIAGLCAAGLALLL